MYSNIINRIVKFTLIANLLAFNTLVNAGIFAYANDCRLLITRDSTQWVKCTDTDCGAVLAKNAEACHSGDCRAIVNDNKSLCSTGDCQLLFTSLEARAKFSAKPESLAVVLKKIADKCGTDNCKAYVYRDASLCKDSGDAITH